MQHRAVRLFLAILIFSFFSFYLPAEINWMTGGVPSLSAEWALDFPFQRDLRNPTPAEEFKLSVDFHELRTDSGIKYQNNQLDLTNRIIYMPTFFDTFQAGFGFTWHLYRYFQEFTENDLIFTTRFRWIHGPVFSFENAYGLFFKFAEIDAILQNRPLIFNLSYHFELMCNWHFAQTSDLWCGLWLQDYFDYPLAISPIIKFGYNFSVSPNVVLGTDLSFKFVDMFFSAIYLNEAALRVSFKVVI